MNVREDLMAVLQNLSHSHRIAFCASCCERMFPSYQAFSKETDWGRPTLLRDSLDRSWLVASGSEIGVDEVRQLALDCSEAAPDTEKFEAILTSAALDAVSAVVETLELCVDDKLDRCSAVQKSAFDSIDLYVQRTELSSLPHSDLSSFIASHFLWVQETRKQTEDLTFLTTHADLTIENLAELRTRSMYSLLTLHGERA